MADRLSVLHAWTRDRLPSRKSRPIVRALGYAVVLGAALAWASYHFVWSHPEQVRRRLASTLASVFATEVEVNGARSSWREGTRIDEVTVRAPRSFDGVSTLLRLRDLGWRGDGVPCPDAGTGQLDAVLDAARAAGVDRQVVACTGQLRLERRAAELGGSERWSFTETLQPGVLEELAAGEPLQLAVRDLEVALRTGRGATLEEESAVLRQVVVQCGEGRVWGAARLRDGRVEWSWSPGTELIVRGRADGVERIETWIPFAPPTVASYVRWWSPRGSTTLDLRELRWRGADDWRLDAVLGHFESTLRVPGTELELSGVSGSLRLTESAAVWGSASDARADAEEAPSAPGRGRLWGQRVEIRGRTTLGDEVDVELLAPPAALEMDLTRSGPPAMRAPWTRLRPRGEIEGRVAVTGPAAWSTSWVGRGLRAAALAGLTCAEARLALDTTTSSGRLELEGLAWSDWLTASGSVAVAWDDAEVRLRWSDVEPLALVASPVVGDTRPEDTRRGERVPDPASPASPATPTVPTNDTDETAGAPRSEPESESKSESKSESDSESKSESESEPDASDEPSPAPSGDATNDEAAPQPSAARGAAAEASASTGAGDGGEKARLEGDLRFLRATARWQGTWKWENVPFATGLARCDGVSGGGRFPPDRPAAARLGLGLDGAVAEGQARLGPVTVMPNVLGAQAVPFETGRASWELTGDGLRLRGLELVGADAIVRARGTIGWQGDLDLVVVRVDGARREAISKLDLEAPPARWLDGAGPNYTAYRVGGGLEAPLSRPIGAFDAAFQEPR